MDKNEKIIVEKKVSKDKNENKNSSNKKFMNKLQMFFYGIGKEFERTAWTPISKLFSDFIVVVIVVTLLAILFTGIAIFMVKFIG